jgi:acyl-CoA thioester hydrolase
MRHPYFKTAPGDPAPLTLTVERRIRFEEVDPLGIVWHGRYPSYFEDARTALGDTYGIGYLDFHGQGIVTPIKRMQVDYELPLKFGETCSITASLYWTRAARINYGFEIRNQEGKLTTTGCSVQLFLNLEGCLLMAPPDFYADFCLQWAQGTI